MSQHPFVEAHNDLLLGRRLRSRSPGLAILEGSPDPAQVLAVFGCLSAAVCMRYHSLLFGDRMATSVIPVPYAPKCEAWIADHGLRPVPLDPGTLPSAIRGAVGVRRKRQVA
jgi:polysaccharide pyruvyl transferase WcaK-like protein